MLPFEKCSSKLKTQTLQPKISSPKSVTTYIKEFKDAENFKEESVLNEDPTKLNNVLNALKSSKKYILYRQSSEKIVSSLNF